MAITLGGVVPALQFPNAQLYFAARARAYLDRVACDRFHVGSLQGWNWWLSSPGGTFARSVRAPLLLVTLPDEARRFVLARAAPGSKGLVNQGIL